MGRLHNRAVAGAILAGGSAMRLGGTAKGSIDVGNGVSIIGRLIEELAEAGIGDIVIVANDPEPYQDCGITIIPDIRSGMGPIGGIEAALAYFQGRSDGIVFVPCDMPNISAKEISALIAAFIETKPAVVFAETGDFFWHPLCAVVHNGLKETVSAAIDNGQRKIRDVWQQVNATSVRFPQEGAFLNINDPIDMDRWRKAENENANLR